MKTSQDFRMIQGDTKKIQVNIDEDLSGASIKWGFSNVLKTLGDGITVNSQGFEILLNPADTELLSGYYIHEAEITDAQGYVSTVMRGRLQIIKDII